MYIVHFMLMYYREYFVAQTTILVELIVIVENLDPSKEYDSRTLIFIFCSLKKLDPGDLDLCSWYGNLPTYFIMVGMLEYVKIYFCSCYINFYLELFPTNYLRPESILT